MSPALRPVVALCAVLLSGDLTCQTWVWPASYATRPGEGALNTPFSVATGVATNASRLLVVIQAASLPFPSGTVIHELAFRRDRQDSSTAYGAMSGQLRVLIGTTSVAPDQIHDAHMGDLWSAAPTQCLDAAVSLPAAAAPGATLPGFTAVFPLAAPFTWTSGNLVIDLRFIATPPTTWRVDAMASPPQQDGRLRPIGAGCRGSNGFLPISTASLDTAVPGSTLHLRVDQTRIPATAQAPDNFALSWLGDSASQYSGVPLPFSLQPLGLPSGCWLRTSMTAVQVVPVGSPSLVFARAESFWRLPSDPGLVGATLYAQWLLNDSGLTAPLRMTVSDALAITLGTPDPAPHRWIGSVLWRYGATGSDHESGVPPYQELAPVIRFR